MSGSNGAAQRRGGLLARVQRGVVAARPLRMCVYGVKGIGKSTFASCARAPIFLDCERGTEGLDVARAPVSEWEDLRQVVRDLTHEQHDYSSVVIDTVDAADRLAQVAVCSRKHWQSVDDQEYGRGWAEVEGAWARLLDDLTALQARRHVNLILVGHAQVSRMRPPDADEYDAWLPRVNKRVASLLGGWAEEVLFATYEVNVKRTKKGRSTGRAEGGRRVLRTSWTPAVDAKNRRQLPPVLPLDWAAFADALRRGAALSRAPEPDPEPDEPESLDDLMEDAEAEPQQAAEPEPAAEEQPSELEPVTGAPDDVAQKCDGLEADALHLLSQIPGDAMPDDARAKWALAIRAASAKRDVGRLEAGKARLRQMVGARAKEAK